MKKIAVFPGSFDPITLGHLSVIRRALPLFDQIIVAIGINSEKKSMFSLEQRKAWISEIFDQDSGVVVASYSGLTIDFCKQSHARFLLRGLRSGGDFEFESSIAQVNKKLAPEVETVFLLTDSEYAPISSSIVRDVIRHGGDIRKLVPAEVKP